MAADLVAVFVRVAEARSFSGAARALSVPTSTVSRAIARLENDLGVRLFQRSTRALSLTRDGEALLARVARPLADLRAALERTREGSDAPRGTLRLTAPSDLAVFVGRLVASFAERYPHVEVDAVLTNRRVELVREGFDLALRAGRVTDPGLIARKVLDTSSRLFAAPSYVERRGVPVTVDDLRHHDFVFFRGVDRLVRLRSGTREVEVEPGGRLRGDDFGFVHGAVLAGSGIGLLPTVLACRDLSDGKLVPVLREWSSWGGGLYVAYPEGRNVPVKVKAFRDFAIEAFRDTENVASRFVGVPLSRIVEAGRTAAMQ